LKLRKSGPNGNARNRKKPLSAANMVKKHRLQRLLHASRETVIGSIRTAEDEKVIHTTVVEPVA
jgi:hypothetical protein